ncbi:homeobox protein Hox-B3-like [Microplitis mediator]|uniref:homeobox protein Hox-B3-like n=1 Tax=Microplitis mediator TaxID=375433 RepID=UPI00255265B8|nr:homeobox protein Hox-B3-like [Microplitis mediator]
MYFGNFTPRYNPQINRGHLPRFELQQQQNQCCRNMSPSQEIKQAVTEEQKNSKRNRTTYTEEQLSELQRIFCENNYPCREARIETGFRLGLTEQQVKVWFQNYRMKVKKTTGSKVDKIDKKNLNPPKNGRNQLLAAEDVDRRRMNPLGLGSTIHYHHSPPNQDMGFKNDGNYWTNGTNYQPAYSGSMQNATIYTESSDAQTRNSYVRLIFLCNVKSLRRDQANNDPVFNSWAIRINT